MKRITLDESRVPVNGLRIFTRSNDGSASSRAPLVFVHGAVISGRYMVPTAERLAVDHRVFVPDLPGFGLSEDPPAPLPVPALATALREWLDALDLPRAHLVGNSLGTQVIVDLASREPSRVASAVLVGPTVDRSARTRIGQLWRLAKDALRERRSLIPLHLRDIARAGPRFAAASLDIALDDAIEEKLPRVQCPVRIVCGSRDPLAPVEWCAYLESITPTASMTVIDGPHALNYSRPDELAADVRAFVAGVA